jgi:hypothetical protein
MVEYYYCDGRFFKQKLGKTLIKRFKQIFEDLQFGPPYKYFFISDEKEPRSILKEFFEMFPFVYTKVYLNEQFASFDYLWHIFLLIYVRLNVDNPYDQEDALSITKFVRLDPGLKSKFYTAFYVFLQVYSEFIWNRCPPGLLENVRSGVIPQVEVDEKALNSTKLEIEQIVQTLDRRMVDKIKRLFRSGKSVKEIGSWLYNRKVDRLTIQSILVLFPEYIGMMNQVYTVKLFSLIEQRLNKLQDSTIRTSEELNLFVVPSLTLVQLKLFENIFSPQNDNPFDAMVSIKLNGEALATYSKILERLFKNTQMSF